MRESGGIDVRRQPSRAADALIGRTTELALVSAFVERPETWPRALIVEGEAGIGKTSLWREAVGLARERVARVLLCRPSGADVNLSFVCLGDLLREDLDVVLSTLPPPQRRALEAALALADPGGAGADYRTIGLAVLAALRVHAASGPVLVAVDDLQWVDAPSARVLDFAFRRLEGERIALLATVRLGDAPPAPLEVEELFAASPERFRLAALSLGALQELLRRRLGLMLPRPLLARLHATTGGNAFYALEIAGALDVRDAAVRPGAPLPVPATLQELVSRRLGRLPTPTRETLLAVSALAQPRSSVLVDWAGSGDRVARDLGRARRAGVVELDDDRIRFSHPLLGSGLYAQTDVSARRRMHSELARVVSDPEERVRHLARACAGPDPAVVAALEQAAERAQARGAPDAALELLDEAIRLTTNEQTTELARLALRAAEAAHIVGDDARARAMLERVAAERSAGGLRTRALVLLTRVVHDFEASARLMRDACAEGVDDLRLRSEIERNLAASAWATVEEVFVGLEHAQAAVRFAEQAGDEAAYSHAIAWLARLQSLAGLPVHEDLQARVEAPPRLDEEPLRLVQGARFTWAEVLMGDDELTQASETLEGLRRQAATVGNFQALAPVLQLLALVLWRRGDWSTARRVAQEAVDNARASGDDTGLVPALASLACVEVHLGNIESARDTTAEGIALVETTHFRYAELRLRHALGALELSLGAPETACEHLAGVASSRWAVGYRDPSLVRTVPDEVEGLVALGELQRAHDALTPFQRYAKMLNRRWALGTAARCQGLLAAATGNQSAASEAFEHALELQRQLPEPYELARTLLTYGVARRRAKSRGEARELLEEAAKIFERLGGRIWAERARREIGRAGGRRGPRDELTATERRVAELVAEGRTNKAVAGELFMSVKTVEGNLSRVYRKLGVSSRTQLARRLRKPQDS